MSEQQRTSAARIVVGVDGSEPSKAALRWAARQAALTGGVVEAVTSWQYPQWYGASPMVADFDFADNARSILTQAIDEALGPDRPAGIRPRVVCGHPAGVLLDAARGAELLVVGSRGLGGFAGALLGSVSQHLVQHAACPVVVIRGSADAPTPASAA
ncbi:universal stress protein [Streptomyces kebangsaanensis]|uniref:universal stress protein n=1 Tax=Streptomyces kebangsaanensis TaxID=864058 RepID=UPI00093D0D2E|nr:universal stress protein [Streptomyces kebangsaanensis]